MTYSLTLDYNPGMNASIALREFSQRAEHDAAFFNVSQTINSGLRGLVWILLRVVLFVPFVAFAQVTPFVFRRHLALILPHLPEVTDPQDLAWLKDAFTLYHETLKGYQPYCLFRHTTRETLDELDEQIDSLEFVITNAAFLRETLDQIEQR